MNDRKPEFTYDCYSIVEKWLQYTWVNWMGKNMLRKNTMVEKIAFSKNTSMVTRIKAVFLK
jgi:hypothetical protein